MGVKFPRVGTAVYRSPQWKAVRLMAKRRDGWACVQCGAKGKVEVDHIAPLRTAPERAFDLSNLQCLCPACHARKTRVEVGNDEIPPDRKAWRDLLRDMQRNPSSNEVNNDA